MAEEKIFTIPLRLVFDKPRTKRAKIASNLIKNFLQRHMDSEEINIGNSINKTLFARGQQKVPRLVRIHAIKENDIVYAELLGTEIKPISKKELEEKEKKKKSKEERIKEDRKERRKKSIQEELKEETEKPAPKTEVEKGSEKTELEEKGEAEKPTVTETESEEETKEESEDKSTKEEKIEERV